jgi:K+-transporting ATPase ATPase C chain
MISETRKQIRIAIKLLIVFTVLTGFIYPLVVTGLAQLFFPWQANGSILKVGDKAIGSRLIGQAFTDPKYFWGRPSATTPFPYNASSSSGSNLGPSNPDFLSAVQKRVNDLKKANPQAPDANSVPVDLVTASGSGLDPEISPRAAYYQVPRVAKARGQSEDQIRDLVDHLIKPRTFGILGEPRVNVLELNLALDNATVHH